jgi:hypothetical protein
MVKEVKKEKVFRKAITGKETRLYNKTVFEGFKRNKV